MKPSKQMIDDTEGNVYRRTAGPIKPKLQSFFRLVRNDDDDDDK